MIYEYIHKKLDDSKSVYRKNFLKSFKTCRFKNIYEFLDTFLQDTMAPDRILKRFQSTFSNEKLMKNRTVGQLRIRAIFTEFLPSVSKLSEYLSGDLPIIDKINILRKIPNVINYLNNTLGILHFDLHSQNILVMLEERRTNV